MSASDVLAHALSSFVRGLGASLVASAVLFWVPVAPVVPAALTVAATVSFVYLVSPDIALYLRKREESAKVFALRKDNEALLYTIENEEKAYQARRDARKLLQEHFLQRLPFDRASAELRGMSQGRWKRATDHLVAVGVLADVGQGKQTLQVSTWREGKELLDGFEQQLLSRESFF